MDSVGSIGPCNGRRLFIMHLPAISSNETFFTTNSLVRFQQMHVALLGRKTGKRKLCDSCRLPERKKSSGSIIGHHLIKTLRRERGKYVLECESGATGGAMGCEVLAVVVCFGTNHGKVINTGGVGRGRRIVT